VHNNYQIHVILNLIEKQIWKVIHPSNHQSKHSISLAVSILLGHNGAQLGGFVTELLLNLVQLLLFDLNVPINVISLLLQHADLLLQLLHLKEVPI
jgi:hypothetical protein